MTTLPLGPTPSEASTVRRAYAAMERMRLRIDELENAHTQPIAIVGTACRFPGGVLGPEDLWDLLLEGGDAVSEVPLSRWDSTVIESAPRWGGFLDRIDRFDHEFFGISHREAASMDPQQRIAMEVTWHALESAGIPPDSLAGTATDVYMGVCGNDYYRQVFRSPRDIVAHASTGTAHSILTGRISYSLDLRGASISVDTACSSSLVALDQACRSLRNRQSDTALCGAVNTVLSPDAGISFARFPQMLAENGRCKTFDAAADGFVRSEGCGVVVLRRLSDALREGNRVLAVIRGSAVNQDGRSSGLTAPNGSAQVELLHRALRDARVGPEQVGLVETHGAGTSLGDPIEVDALAEVYGRSEGPPLYLGAVKTNLGHVEGAAGMAGLIKTVLCLQHGLVPPNLHFEKLNPHISFDGTTFAVPTETVPWPDVDGVRRAGVSSFGFSGTNAHVVLEQAPDTVSRPSERTRPRSVLTLSAKSEASLLTLAHRYQGLLERTGQEELAEVCGASTTGRSHLEHRLAVTGASPEEMMAGLAEHVRGEAGPGTLSGRAEAMRPGVVFLFTGQGVQRPGMARELYETEATFREVVDRCDEILRPELPVSLLDVLYPKDPANTLVDEMEYAQPALFAVEYALARLWESWGVRPAAVLGHSLGEYVAACVAGVMSLPDALRLVAARGRLLGDLAGRGSMVTIFASEKEVADSLAHEPATAVSVAAVNGPESTTISGLPEAVERVRATLREQGVDSRSLRISTASHSPLVEEIMEPLRGELEKVSFSPPRIPLISNVTGDFLPWKDAPGPDYWCTHTREPVRFADGVNTLHESGYKVFVEIGPAPTLAGMAAGLLPPEALVLPSLRRDHPAWETLLTTLGNMHVHGVDIDWRAHEGGWVHSPVALPSYPFESVRCWHSVEETFVPKATSSARPGDGPSRARVERRTSPRRSPGGEQSSPLPSAEEVLAVPAVERAAFLVEPLLRGVRAALGTRSASVEADRPLLEMGLDSLMAVELRNEIRRRLSVEMSVSSFLAGTTVRDVAEDISARLDGTEHAGAVPELRRRAAPTHTSPEPVKSMAITETEGKSHD